MKSTILFLLIITSIVCDCDWGTYRPGPYIGVKKKSSSTPLFGVMWYQPDGPYSVESLRHFAENSDNLKKFGYLKHDGCNFGKQEIVDEKNNIKLTNIFVRNDDSWIMRLIGEPIDESKPSIWSIVWYISSQYPSYLNKDNFPMISFDGDDYEMFHVEKSDNQYPIYNNKSFNKNYFLTISVPNSPEPNPERYLKVELGDTVGITPNTLIDVDNSYRSRNLNYGDLNFQQKFFKGKFEIDIHLMDISYKKLSFDEVTDLINFRENYFDLKFKTIFDISDKSEEVIKTAKFALSNLMGNIIYTYGDLYYFREGVSNVLRRKNMELLAVGPDKTRHPHGFMWDEGFQQRLLSQWDMDLSLDIVKNWFKNIDPNTGWMPREQMFDDDARIKSSPSSWVQIDTNTNPPSLYLFLDNLLDGCMNNGNLTKDNCLKLNVLIKSIMPEIELNSKWFINLQKNKNDETVYFWKGTTEGFCLPSGLDDYPRSFYKSETFVTGHVDLQSWMIVLVRTVKKAKIFIDQSPEEYENLEKIFIQSLKDNFWDSSYKVFDDFDRLTPTAKAFVSHRGYLQLFPFILDIFQNDKPNNNIFNVNNKIIYDTEEDYDERALDFLSNEVIEMITDYGVRSMSPHDVFYRQGQNYWTSPIWININFLILKKLNKMKLQGNQRASDLYNKIRNGLIDTVSKSYSQTNFIWEVYDDTTGKGIYNHPFTGWSALIFNIIFEKY